MEDPSIRYNPELENIFDFVISLRLPKGIIAASAIAGYLTAEHMGRRLSEKELLAARRAGQCVALALSGDELAQARQEIIATEPVSVPVSEPQVLSERAGELVVAGVG